MCLQSPSYDMEKHYKYCLKLCIKYIEEFSNILFDKKEFFTDDGYNKLYKELMEEHQTYKDHLLHIESLKRRAIYEKSLEFYKALMNLHIKREGYIRDYTKMFLLIVSKKNINNVRDLYIRYSEVLEPTVNHEKEDYIPLISDMKLWVDMKSWSSLPNKHLPSDTSRWLLGINTNYYFNIDKLKIHCCEIGYFCHCCSDIKIMEDKTDSSKPEINDDFQDMKSMVDRKEKEDADRMELEGFTTTWFNK